MNPQTLYDKLWNSHVVLEEPNGAALLYVDRHLVHEVTSPQAFEGLRLAGRKPWRVESIVATADHNTPTRDWDKGIRDPISRAQVETLDANIREFGAKAYFPFLHKQQGIVHVIGPEQGATLPGMTVVCGDSHTSTHGAFACLAWGIGTSEVEHVLATQCLVQKKAHSMRVEVEGRLPRGVTAKDIALAVIGRVGTAGGTGSAIEFAGSAVGALSMEGRMTLCNMSIEAGARAGMVALDDTTLEYIRGGSFAPKGALWDRAVSYWRTLKSDPGAKFDTLVRLDGAAIKPRSPDVPHQRWSTPSMARVPTRQNSSIPSNASRWSVRWSIWVWRRTCRLWRSASIRCSSAPAPTRESRTCAPPRRSSTVVRSLPASSSRWWYRVPGWSNVRPKPRGWIASFGMLASSGASQAVPCAWR